MLAFVSLLAGFALGWNHFRLYRRSMEAFFESGSGHSSGRKNKSFGLFRHVLTFAAGILLIRVARLDPFHLCGGLFAASVVYRVYLYRVGEQKEGC